MPTIFDASAQKQAKEADRLAQELQSIVSQEKKKKKKRRRQSAEKSQEIHQIQQEDPELNPDFPTQGPVEDAVLTPGQPEITPEAVATDSFEPAAEIREDITVPPENSAAENTPKEDPMPDSAEKRQPSDYSEVLRHEKPSNGTFSAFFTMPSDVMFESQHPEEKILMVLRQHPIVTVPAIVIGIALLLAPFLVFPILPFFQFLPSQYGFFTMVAWFMFVAIYFFETFLSWYFNLYVITDERIIDIDFYSLVYKAVSEAKIERIEDVTATSGGFFAALFNYGTITIQTAAEKREFEFVSVPQPAKVTKFLNELILEEERERAEGRVM